VSEVFDSLILGGGPGGSTAAALLARAGWSVAVVEKATFPRSKVCGEFVSATNRPLFDQLGITEAFLDQAGPEVHRVGLFTGSARLVAPMPGMLRRNMEYGHALSRENLDTLLLDAARRAGARVWQPWTATSLVRQRGEFVCRVVSRHAATSEEIRARIVIAAHGSWEPGQLPTQTPRSKTRGSDLFGFKARLVNASLPVDLMPLLVFPGGYGGMVQSDGGRLSLSCCVRRDQLERLRTECAGASAVEAVLRHIKETCLGVREVLADARPDGAGLAVGPIRPGIRRSPDDGIFLVGNAAGEAHPIVAEGISMAMQSAWVLCRRLMDQRKLVLSGHGLREARIGYEKEWRRCFAPRLRAASLFARLALHPASVGLSRTLLERFPALLSWGARWSGKSREVVQPILAS
jgi:flavin-dependent dehydrogenase